MSRLGKTPIKIPKGVEIKISGKTLNVKGPKGSTELELPEAIVLRLEADLLHVEFVENKNFKLPVYGLYRSLINNNVIGVSTGFEKKLALIGVGYRAVVKGSSLDLQLGFSHPCQIAIPEGVKVTVAKSTTITIQGMNKQVVGQFAANVRAFRPPEPYKGKGVRYVDEYVRKKAGKAAKGK